MAQFKRLAVLNAMARTGLVPVFYHEDVATGISIINACADGGANVIEFTNRGDRAFMVFAELASHFARNRPDVCLGVGSVVDAPTAAMYINCGANFVVGPVLNAEVARVCNRRKVAYSPGCGSASEVSAAEELGCEIVKIFPGEQVGGPAFVKGLLGPCPWSCIMPTGGVDATKESISAWFKAGVTCVGMGSNLVTKESVAAKDWAGITARAQQVIQWIAQVQKK